MAETKDKNAEQLDKILGHLDSLHEKHDAGSKRMDALSEGLGALTGRMDALEGSKEKEAADAAARRDAAKADAESKTGTEQDRSKFAAAQMRCDAAYQAWSKQAPPGLHGEQLRDYRIRLLTPLKRHSKAYADSALDLVGDPAVFDAIEKSIVADAIIASSTTFTPMGPLRAVVSRMDSGHVVTRFVGDPAVAWGPFMGGATKFGRINIDLANKARQ